MYKMTTGSPSPVVITALQWVSETESPFSEGIMTLSQQAGISMNSVPSFFITDAPKMSQRRKSFPVVTSSQD